ncbi:MAG: NAD(P)H-binding protein [Chthoniobacteraceae bacterium]
MTTIDTTNESKSDPAIITVMGATGRIGKRISQQLLSAGVKVRALGRSESKLAELGDCGAETRVGEAAAPAFLTETFRGADAVYTLLPYDPRETSYHAQQRRVGEAIISALGDSGVRRVVFLSSVGADQSSGTGMLVSMHDQEERLRRLDGVDVLILRPGPFFENLQGFTEMIRHEGITGDAFAPDLALPMIATRDISDAATAALLARDWSGVVVRELLGQRDLSFAEATRIIGERLGRSDLQYVQFPYDAAAEALAQFGFSAEIARLEVEVARAANEGRAASREGRTARNTTATPFEAFADELARAYLATEEAVAS